MVKFLKKIRDWWWESFQIYAEMRYPIYFPKEEEKKEKEDGGPSL